MHSLEEYLKELSEDLTGLLADMTPEERQMAKTKITTLGIRCKRQRLGRITLAFLIRTLKIK